MGAPFTLADVFLALGSGFGGAGFCKDKLNYANTDKVQLFLPRHPPKKNSTKKLNQKNTKRLQKTTMHFDYDFVHLKNIKFYFQHQLIA